MHKQLEGLATEFDAWRSKRVKRTATPDTLIAKALSLRGHVSDAEIVRALRINSTALKNWANQHNPIETAAQLEAPTQFVELPHSSKTGKKRVPRTDSWDKDNMSTLNVALPSGVSLSLTGNPGALVDFVLQLSQQGAL